MSVAIYLRLSLEEDSTKESDSIANQRQLLKNFISTHPELREQPCIEIVDDGYTGTSLERPGLKRLLDLAETSLIDCIVVKDFSRFARNYIEAGYYLEEVFPARGLRFISVNDGFDSFENKAENQGLNVAFRNLIYDLYSKDLSTKVRTAREAKMRRGEYISAYAIYGYAKSLTDKNSLVVDQEAASVVKEIFGMICKGYSTTQTAKLLNLKDVPTPMQYKQQKSIKRSWSKQTSNLWTKDAITRIVRDRRYTGDMVSNKRKRKQTGDIATIKVPQQQWLVATSTHPAIISQEQYAQAQEMLLLYQEYNKTIDKSRVLYGRVICGCCGHVMRYKKATTPYYFCETSQYDTTACTNSDRITKDELEQVLLSVLRTQVRLLCDIDGLTARWQQQALTKLRSCEQAYFQQQMQGESLSASKINLYETYRKGTITKEQYLAKRQALDKRHQEVLLKLRDQQDHIQALSSQRLGLGEVAEIYQHNAFIPQLTAQIASAAVESVHVLSGCKLQIKLRSADYFKNV